MSRGTRTERRAEARAKTRRIGAMAGSAAALALLLTGAVLAAVHAGGSESPAVGATAAAVDITLEETSTLEDPDPAREVEVPDVAGKPLDEAQMLLAYAGFTPLPLVAAEAPEGVEPGTVVAQEPPAGTLLAEGAEVTVEYAPIGQRPQAAAPAEHYVVVIDPGHQAQGDLDLEPNGPGSSEMKEKVRGGATGVTTRIPEYETVLRISLQLRDRLVEEGVEVVMTRTTNDVDISNRERAEIANRAGADLFIRVHGDGAGDPDVHGASTLYPAGNSWVSPIEVRSKRAAERVQAALVAATGAADRGIAGRSDITGFNWAKVPSVLVECGFLSNPAEDKLLSGDDYRKSVADGIADGVMEYLRAP